MLNDTIYNMNVLHQLLILHKAIIGCYLVDTGQINNYFTPITL